MQSMIRFQFQPETAIQAAGYLLTRLGGRTDKVKLTKLLYLADRDHFLAFGRPITRDQQWALPLGPVPSCTLDLLNGSIVDGDDYAATHIGSSNYHYTLSRDPGQSMLCASDLDILNGVLEYYGKMHAWALRDFTHKLPEYVECHIENSSAPIPYETILRHYGSPARFRKNRPVIMPDMAASMVCPFPNSEPEL